MSLDSNPKPESSRRRQEVEHLLPDIAEQLRAALGEDEYSDFSLTARRSILRVLEEINPDYVMSALLDNSRRYDEPDTESKIRHLLYSSIAGIIGNGVARRNNREELESFSNFMKKEVLKSAETPF
ncbi:MAG: hypothetical protein NUV59_02945 [Patescibacteria group bacterium]|nr:hypothetical protein [Patescibacteria group bacterium]